MENVQTRNRSKTNAYISKKYKVIFWNDNQTTFDFVVTCLKNIFDKSIEEAILLTYEVDRKGSAVAGTGYIKDIAETKKDQVLVLAKENGYPFKVTVEEE